MIKTRQKNKGFIILIAMLIIAAVTVAIASTLILLGLDSSRSSFVLEQSYQSKALADLCIEEALQVIHFDNNFSGTGFISEGLGRCGYEVFDLGGDSRWVESFGTVDSGKIIRRTVVNINNLSSEIGLSSWEEVGDF